MIKIVIFILNVFLSPYALGASDSSHLRDLGAIITDPNIPYSIETEIKKLSRYDGQKTGLIIGRGNIQHIQIVDEAYGDMKDVIWTFCDPDQKAHDFAKPDPLLMMDMNMRNGVVKGIIDQLREQFDYAVFDVETIKYFKNFYEVIFMVLPMLKESGNIIVPLDFPSTEAILLSLGTSINYDRFYKNWPFQSKKAPGNYSLDAASHKYPVRAKICKDLVAQELIDQVLLEAFRQLDDYDSLLVTFLYPISMGTPTRVEKLTRPIRHDLTFLWKNMNSPHGVMAVELIRKVEVLKPDLQAFAYWMIGEYYLHHHQRAKSLEYYTLSFRLGCVLSFYRITEFSEQNLNHLTLDNYLCVVKDRAMERLLTGTLISEHMDNMKDLECQFASLMKKYPALVLPTITRLQFLTNPVPFIQEIQLRKLKKERGKIRLEGGSKRDVFME